MRKGKRKRGEKDAHSSGEKDREEQAKGGESARQERSITRHGAGDNLVECARDAWVVEVVSLAVRSFPSTSTFLI